MINVDQSPIGRTPRSQPGHLHRPVHADPRAVRARCQAARERGYGPGRFSFNVKGGRCEACQGDGVIKVEMHFLPDVYVPCDVCHGQRYNRETLEIRYKGKNIHEVLDDDGRGGARVLRAGAGDRAQAADAARRRASATSRSARARPRCRAARRSASSSRSSCPSATPAARSTSSTSRRPACTSHDIDLLLTVLHRLRDHGNTVVVIEHNLDVIKTADWIIDLGPGGRRRRRHDHRAGHARRRSPRSRRATPAATSSPCWVRCRSRRMVESSAAHRSARDDHARRAISSAETPQAQ